MAGVEIVETAAGRGWRVFLAIAAHVLAAIASAEAAAAQPTLPFSSVRPGDTVRVWTHGPPLLRTVALVSSVGSDRLMLTDVPGRTTRLGLVDVPFGALTRLQLQRGSRSSTSDAVVGLALGSVGGAVLGALVAGIVCSGSSSYEGDCAGFGPAILGAAAGAVAGSLTGAYLGHRPRPRWRPVALRPSYR